MAKVYSHQVDRVRTENGLFSREKKFGEARNASREYWLNAYKALMRTESSYCD